MNEFVIRTPIHLVGMGFISLFERDSKVECSNKLAVKSVSPPNLHVDQTSFPVGLETVLHFDFLYHFDTNFQGKCSCKFDYSLYPCTMQGNKALVSFCCLNQFSVLFDLIESVAMPLEGESLPSMNIELNYACTQLYDIRAFAVSRVSQLTCSFGNQIIKMVSSGSSLSCDLKLNKGFHERTQLLSIRMDNSMITVGMIFVDSKKCDTLNKENNHFEIQITKITPQKAMTNSKEQQTELTVTSLKIIKNDILEEVRCIWGNASNTAGALATPQSGSGSGLMRVRCAVPEQSPLLCGGAGTVSLEVSMLLADGGRATSESGLAFWFEEPVVVVSAMPSAAPAATAVTVTVTGAGFRNTAALSCRVGRGASGVS
jgi:hypothetical protein